MRVIKTRIEGLDEILGGGIPKGSLIYISGAPGTGKSILATQFLIEGARREGEVGLYLTIEEYRDKYINHMESLGWDLKKMEDLQQLIIIDFPPWEVEQLISPTNPLKGIIEDYDISRVVIDSIIPIAVSFEEDSKRKRAFFQLVANINSWNTTTIAIGETISFDPLQGVPALKYGFESLSDGWFHMYYKREGLERKKYIEIIKLKGMKHSNKLHEFDIDNGIVIKP